MQDSLTRRCGDINIYDIGPCEFIYLLRRAKYVVTNSFHGLAFSFIFGKDVISLESKERNMRLENLIQLFGAENVQIKNMQQYITNDWKEIWKTVQKNAKQVIPQNKEEANAYFEKYNL